MANKEEKQINPWDLLRADVKMYQADCLFSVGFYTQCQRCTKNVFDSIINMINQRAKQAGSGAPERKTGEWNRITRRPMDAEEREFWEAEIMGEIADDEAYIYENLPEEGEEVFVCTKSGRVFIDTMCRDEGCYFEEDGDLEDVVAWMPLPKPYREVNE